MLTDAELEREYPTDPKLAKEYPDSDRGWNPKWIQCHRNLGRRPQAWEFMLWNSARIREFEADPERIREEQALEDSIRATERRAAERERRHFKEPKIPRHFCMRYLSDEGHKAFDAWLKANAGRKGWDRV